jgi:Two-component sensor kinase N-terminal
VILGSTWQAHYEISESMDSALDKSAHRLLDLSQQDLDTVFRWANSPEVTERMRHGDEDHLVYQIVNRNNQVMFRSGNAPKDALSHSLRTDFADVGAWRVSWGASDRPSTSSAHWPPMPLMSCAHRWHLPWSGCTRCCPCPWMTRRASKPMKRTSHSCA